MSKIRPLIVCGMGRSGTRMCANILNNSDLVELQGEIGGPAGTKMVIWLEAARRQRHNESSDGVYALARAAFQLGSAGRALDRPDARWFGHKTPRHERHFGRYENIFSDPDNLATYVYCLRNPFDVWRSYRAMPWNKFANAAGFVRAWTKSVRNYELMKSRAGERVLTFHLDDFIASPDRLDYLRPVLLDPLGISSDTFSRPVDELKNSNSALTKVGVIPEPLPDADVATIGFDKEVRRMIDAYFPALDVDAMLANLPAPHWSLSRASTDLRWNTKRTLKRIGRKLVRAI